MGRRRLTGANAREHQGHNVTNAAHQYEPFGAILVEQGAHIDATEEDQEGVQREYPRDGAFTVV